MNRLVLVIIGASLVALTSSCKPSAPTQSGTAPSSLAVAVVDPGPTADQVRRDLMQKRFFRNYTPTGGQYFMSGTDVELLSEPQVLTDSTRGEAEVTVEAAFAKGNGMALVGPMFLKYRKFDQGWVVQEVRAKDYDVNTYASFALEERPVPRMG